MPANKNGKINPIVYTPIKRKPFAPDSALPAIRRTLVNAGPTHGVHAKLNANPIIKAVIGDIVIFSSRIGNLCSDPRTLELPNTPS